MSNIINDQIKITTILKNDNRVPREKHTASPTVPKPKIAIMEPASTFAVFHTAPKPKYEIINEQEN